MEYPKSDYKQYPKTLPRDDVWGQVRRTIYGRRITEAEIEVLVAAIMAGLRLTGNDVLLDLACGNGALTERLFGSCRAALGVDFSEYLIEIAQEKFERRPDYTFVVGDVAEYLSGEKTPTRFTRALCYGSFQYFSRATAHAVLRGLAERFTNVERLFIGNLPDKDRCHLFFPSASDSAQELDDPAAQIGIWWSEHDIAELAETFGWQASFSRLPPDIFNARYRFDATLVRA